MRMRMLDESKTIVYDFPSLYWTYGKKPLVCQVQNAFYSGLMHLIPAQRSDGVFLLEPLGERRSGQKGPVYVWKLNKALPGEFSNATGQKRKEVGGLLGFQAWQFFR